MHPITEPGIWDSGTATHVRHGQGKGVVYYAKGLLHQVEPPLRDCTMLEGQPLQVVGECLVGVWLKAIQPWLAEMPEALRHICRADATHTIPA